MGEMMIRSILLISLLVLQFILSSSFQNLKSSNIFIRGMWKVKGQPHLVRIIDCLRNGALSIKGLNMKNEETFTVKGFKNNQGEIEVYSDKKIGKLEKATAEVLHLNSSTVIRFKNGVEWIRNPTDNNSSNP